LLLHAAIGVGHGGVDHGAGAVGDDPGRVDLVGGIVIVLADGGLILGDQPVAHVNVVLHAGPGAIILGQQFAVVGMDVIGRAVEGGAHGRNGRGRCRMRAAWLTFFFTK